MPDSFRHYILTRFNVGFRDGKTVAGHEVDHAKWLSARLDLFERFTFPSLRAQKEKRFIWLLCFSPETPKELLPRIMAYQNAQTRVIFSHRGCDAGSPPLIRVKGEGLEETLIRSHIPIASIPVIEDDLKRSPVDWVVTTRIDSDDVVSNDFTHVIYQAHKAHHFVTVPHGYVYDARTRQVWEKDSLYNAWLTLVEPAVIGQIWTVWIAPHTNPAVGYEKATGRRIPIISRGFDHRRWVALRHDDNSTPLQRGRELSVDVLTGNPLFSSVKW